MGTSCSIQFRMKTFFLLATLTLSLTLTSAKPQNGGLFSGITNAFNNFFGGSSTDNRQQPRPQRPQFQQQQQQFQQPQQQQQQQFQPQQQQFQPQPPRQQQQFQPRPAPAQGSFQQAPVFNPQPQPVRQSVSSSPSFSSSNQVSGGTAKCGAQAPNHFWNGQGFVVTWKFGCRDFEQHEAREYS